MFSKKLFLIGYSLLLFIAPQAQACKCAKYSSIQDMISSADVVFIGRWEKDKNYASNKNKIDTAKNPIYFTPTEYFKGGTGRRINKTFGLTRKLDVPSFCQSFRGNADETKYLVFQKLYKSSKSSILTDCYSDIVSVNNKGEAVYRGKTISRDKLVIFFKDLKD